MFCESSFNYSASLPRLETDAASRSADVHAYIRGSIPQPPLTPYDCLVCPPVPNSNLRQTTKTDPRNMSSDSVEGLRERKPLLAVESKTEVA